MDESKIKEEIWQTILNLNRIWVTNGNLDELENYFHKDMVAITPTDRERLEGRDACIASWKVFVKAAKIHSWEEKDPKIHLFGNGNFAVVTYYYEMLVNLEGENTNLNGRDMFVLVKEDEKWWVVADQFSEYP